MLENGKADIIESDTWNWESPWIKIKPWIKGFSDAIRITSIQGLLYQLPTIQLSTHLASFNRLLQSLLQSHISAIEFIGTQYTDGNEACLCSRIQQSSKGNAPPSQNSSKASKSINQSMYQCFCVVYSSALWKWIRIQMGFWISMSCESVFTWICRYLIRCPLKATRGYPTFNSLP
jgi:hypothetical protein